MKQEDVVLNDLKTLKKLKEITNVDLEENVTNNKETFSSFSVPKNDISKNIAGNIDDKKSEEFFVHPIDEDKESTSFKSYFKRIINTIFPTKCYMCNLKNIDVEKTFVCPSCKEIFRQYKVNKTFYDEKGKEIGKCIYRYDGIVRYLMQRIKFNKGKNTAMALAELSCDEFLEFIRKHHVNYIIPIPMHEDRLKERGFNQAEVIAKIFSEKSGIQMRTDLVGRSHYTLPQSKVKNEERRNNVKNSFKILKENEVEGKDIILIDDIYTTGSTMEECSRVLNEHNTRKVYFLSISISKIKLKGELR